jgi:hypothetical protein
MEGISERAYATHSGLSRGALQKARKTGRLVLFADGSINAAASDARRVAMTDPDQQMRSKGGFGGSGGAPNNGNAVSGPGESTSYLKARTALTVYQAQERQLSIQKKKGVLVDRTGRDAGVPPRAPRTRRLGHLAHSGGSTHGRTNIRRDGKGIGRARDDRDCDPAEGAGNPCPRAAHCPGRPQGLACMKKNTTTV